MPTAKLLKADHVCVLSHRPSCYKARETARPSMSSTAQAVFPFAGKDHDAVSLTTTICHGTVTTKRTMETSCLRSQWVCYSQISLVRLKRYESTIYSRGTVSPRCSLEY